MEDVTISSHAYSFTLHHLLGLAGVWFVYKLLQALYNVSAFHPLSNIPGPTLAAATFLPEFYYDVIKFGCYTRAIRQMHEKYGAQATFHHKAGASRLTANRIQVLSYESIRTKCTATISPLRMKYMLSVEESATSLCIRSMVQREFPYSHPRRTH
jgi:hypothetical protein